MWAVDGKHEEIVRLLIRCGAHVETRGPKGENAIFIAASKGHFACVTSLINAGANVNSLLDDGTSPLMVAAFYGHDDCVKLLLDANAEKEYTNMVYRNIISLIRYEYLFC